MMDSIRIFIRRENNMAVLCDVVDGTTYFSYLVVGCHSGRLAASLCIIDISTPLLIAGALGSP